MNERGEMEGPAAVQPVCRCTMPPCRQTDNLRPGTLVAMYGAVCSTRTLTFALYCNALRQVSSGQTLFHEIFSGCGSFSTS